MKNLNTLILIGILVMAACQKSPVNGDLDGQWQVMEINPVPADPAASRMYYCFSLHTVQLSYHDLPVWTSGNMYYSGNSLRLEFPYADSPLSKARLSQFGINTNPVEFTIIHLSSQRLVMQRGDTVMTLRKF